MQSIFKGFASDEYIIFEKYFVNSIQIVKYSDLQVVEQLNPQ